MTAAEKKQLAEAGKEQAGLVVNNAFIDGLAAQLEEKKKYGLSFPSDYNPTNALMGAYLVLKETKDKNNKPIIDVCSKESIANSLMDMVTFGLSVQKKQGYFIAYGGQCQFQKSYFGNTTIARRYGMKDINASVIYKGDVFEFHKEDAKTVIDKHTQSFENMDNTLIVGAYAVATMQDGEKIAEIMTMAQIKQSWQQGFGYKDGSGTHAKFTDQMCMKTVKNRLLKQINNTHGDTEVAYLDEKEDERSLDDRVAVNASYEIEQNENSVDFEEANDTKDDIVDTSGIDDIDLPDFMRG